MKKFFALTCAIACSIFASADTINTTPFSKQCEFVVEGYSGTTELTDFPVLVRLSESANSPVGFKYADCQSGGADLRFADADGILLPHEIETWDPSGESLVWVRLSSLEGTKTKFFAYYGASSAVAQSVPASDTWSSYVMVIHGGNSISDSSPSALTLTANSVTTNSTGVVGGGMSKSTRNAKGVNIPNPYKNGLFTNNRQYSLSFWAKSPTASDSSTHVTVCGVAGWGNAGFLGLFEKGHGWSVAVSGTHHYTDGKGNLPANTWVHTAFSYDTQAGHLTSYSNGETIYDQANVNTYTDTGVDYWTLGGYADTAKDDNFNGDLDEFRIYDGIASSDWVKAEYDSMTSGSFVVNGCVENMDRSVPEIAVDVTKEYTGLVIHTTVVGFGDGGTSCDLQLTIADNPSFSNPIETLSRTAAQISLGSPIELTVESLAKETPYYIHVVSTNDKGATCDKTIETSTKAIDPCKISVVSEKIGASLATFFWSLSAFGVDSTSATLTFQYSTSQDFNGCSEIPVPGPLTEVPASARAVIRDLSPSTPYWIRLKAVNSLGHETFTPTLTFTTPASDVNRIWANTQSDMNDASSYVEGTLPGPNDIIYFTEPAKVQPHLTGNLSVKGLYFGRYDGIRTTETTDPTGYVFTGDEGAVLELTGANDKSYVVNSLTESGHAEFNVPILLSGKSNPHLAANGISLDFKAPVATSLTNKQDVYTVTDGKDSTHIGVLRFSAANPEFRPSKIHVAGSTHLEINHPDALVAVPEIVSGHWGGTDFPHLVNRTDGPVVLDALQKFSPESYGLNAFYFDGNPMIMTNCEFNVSQRDGKPRYFNASVSMKTIGGWDYSGNEFFKRGTNMLETVGDYYEKDGIISHIQVREGMFYPHQLLQTVARTDRRCRINGDGVDSSKGVYPTLGVGADARIPVSNLGGISFGKDGERKGGGLSGMGGEISVTLTDKSDAKINLVDNVKTPEGSGYIAPYPWAFGNPAATGTVRLENNISRSGDTSVYAYQGKTNVAARLRGTVSISGGNFSKYGNGTLAIEGRLELDSGKRLAAYGGGILVNCNLTDDFAGNVYCNGGNGWIGGTGSIKQFHFESGGSALRGGEFGTGTLTVTGEGTDFKFAGSSGIIVDITKDGSCGLLKFQGDLSTYSSGWSGYWMQVNVAEGAPAGRYKIMDWSEGTGTPTKMMTAAAYETIRFDPERVESATLSVEGSAMYLDFVPKSGDPKPGVFLVVF